MRALAARIERLERGLREEEAKPATPPDPLADPETASLSESLRLVEADIAALEARRDRLDEKITSFQARVEETPRAEQQLASLTRDYQQLRENYNVALKKEMDAEMARRLEEYWKGGYFRVLDPAYLPRRPIRAYVPLFLMARARHRSRSGARGRLRGRSPRPHGQDGARPGGPRLLPGSGQHSARGGPLAAGDGVIATGGRGALAMTP